MAAQPTMELRLSRGFVLKKRTGIRFHDTLGLRLRLCTGSMSSVCKLRRSLEDLGGVIMIVYILLFLFVTIGIFNLIMASLLRMSARTFLKADCRVCRVSTCNGVHARSDKTSWW